MSLATEKDEVLSWLKDKREVDLTDFNLHQKDSPDKHFVDLFYVHLIELTSSGFVEYETNNDQLIDFERTSITPAGHVFFVNGGYAAIEQKEQREQRQKRLKMVFESSSAIAAVVAALAAALTFILAPSENDVKTLQSEVRSLNAQVKALQRANHSP
ncbi:hypothetical protein M0L20_29500 [Spirosoma sp. RP8]|uniref:Uncharacterized protein n=1 Tax=Spirosoma liriopis TaxID=2937440 RepID=A0ABT0HUZ6_9BACT|nr:hypothetical protein [Spirosoma liriopis]MCK8496038.1 hypothetical protein [Spirosoma liriopis]